MDPNLQQFINIVLASVVPVVAAAVGTALAVLLTKLVNLASAYWQILQDKKIAEKLGLSEANLRFARGAIVMLVQAAEQSGIKADIERTGAEKKAWVIDRAKVFLDQQGITGIDVDTLADLVEASLLQGFHKANPPIFLDSTLAL